MIAGMMRLPLPALLSAALVAFTMEFDNQAERQLPHRTTRHGSSGGLHAPWLVSLAMWANCMQFVDEREITVLEIWSPLSGTVESRWENRFGRDAVCRLRRSLEALVRQLDRALPDCLPILGYGLERRPWQNQRSARRHPENLAEAADSVLPSLPLWALLSRPLLAFAMEFERQSGLSLAASANLLRVLDEKGKKLGELPRLSGVSKEAIAVALGVLCRKGLAAVDREPAGRTKRVRLTAEGLEARQQYCKLTGKVERLWAARFGAGLLHPLQAALEAIAGDGKAGTSPLFA